MDSHDSKSLIYQITNLKKNYQDRCVLDIPELNVIKGEFLALVGPSGAGKSTLLRLLNFLEFPTEGQIEFEGQTFQNGTEMPIVQRRQVTTVFQRPLLLNRSVRDNISFGLHLHHREAGQRITDPFLARVGLERLADQSARTLSGGEAQRVALGRAIALRPDVLLLDEPTANLDPANVSLVEQIITQLNRNEGTTIIMVTHHIFQARRLSHRTGFLLDGKIIEINNTPALFASAQDPRTSAFIQGEMIY